MSGSHSDLLAYADFFQQRFSFGSIVGAEMPAGEEGSYVLALDAAQGKTYCSCPFYPRPCIHGAALYQLHQREGNDIFPETNTPPSWLSALLSGQPAATLLKHNDPEKKAASQQKTRFERLERTAHGFEDLDAWLSDTVRRGLATVVSEGNSAFDQIAARTADASMTGLSRTLRLLSKIPDTHPEWAEQVTDVLAQVYLAVRAFRNRAALPELLLYDLQNFIGISIKKEEVLANGERIKDAWAVLGALEEPIEDKLRVRRSWLLGAQSGRMALLLDFAFGGSGFDPGFVAGSIQQGTLVFYPSAFPQRALPQDDIQAIPKKVGKLPGYANIDAFLMQYATALAAQPWLPHYAGVLSQVRVQAEKKNRFSLTDISEKILPLSVPERKGWSLVALGGGQPISVFGEWDGQKFQPLSAIESGRWVNI